MEKLLEEFDLGFELVHLLKRTFLEIFEDLDLRIESLHNFRVPLKLDRFSIKLFPENLYLRLQLIALLLMLHD